MTDQFGDINKMVPPRELIEQWAVEKSYDERDWLYEINLANRAAAWGANQQLEKDAKWLDHNALNEPHLKITPVGESLKEAMRPKSLKEQALEMLECIPTHDNFGRKNGIDLSVIRRALEQLDD